jgi:tryptophan synthase beta subunit
MNQHKGFAKRMDNLQMSGIRKMFELAAKMKKGQNIVINLSGRGDKDLNTVARIEGIEI